MTPPTAVPSTAELVLGAHVDRLAAALPALRAAADTLAHWGGQLADHLHAGGRLLAAGNGPHRTRRRARRPARAVPTGRPHASRPHDGRPHDSRPHDSRR